MPQSYQLHLLDRFVQSLLLEASDTKLTGECSVGSQAQSNLSKAGHLCTSLVDRHILGEAFFLVPKVPFNQINMACRLSLPSANSTFLSLTSCANGSNCFIHP